MKIYNKIKIDIDTGKILEEDSFEYFGPLALCGEEDEGEGVGGSGAGGGVSGAGEAADEGGAEEGPGDSGDVGPGDGVDSKDGWGWGEAWGKVSQDIKDIWSGFKEAKAIPSPSRLGVEIVKAIVKDRPQYFEDKRAQGLTDEEIQNEINTTIASWDKPGPTEGDSEIIQLLEDSPINPGDLNEEGGGEDEDSEEDPSEDPFAETSVIQDFWNTYHPNQKASSPWAQRKNRLTPPEDESLENGEGLGQKTQSLTGNALRPGGSPMRDPRAYREQSLDPISSLIQTGISNPSSHVNNYMSALPPLGSIKDGHINALRQRHGKR